MKTTKEQRNEWRAIWMGAERELRQSRADFRDGGNGECYLPAATVSIIPSVIIPLLDDADRVEELEAQIKALREPLTIRVNPLGPGIITVRPGKDIDWKPDA